MVRLAMWKWGRVLEKGKVAEVRMVKILISSGVVRLATVLQSYNSDLPNGQCPPYLACGGCRVGVFDSRLVMPNTR